MIVPHPYQLEYSTGIRAGWKEFRKQLVVSPTGSGKTNMFNWEIEHELRDGGKALILADQDELVWQPLERLKSLTGIVGDVEKAEHRASLDVRVVAASVQTLMREGRRQRWPKDHFKFIIADEADKSISPSWQAVLNHFDAQAKVLGFTATPHRTDKKNLGVYYENVIEKENLFSLIQKGFLSPVTVQMLPIQIDLSAASTRGGDYDENELDEIITPHLEAIARAVMQYGSFRRTLVFLPLVKTCEKFTEIARSIGVNADYVHGQDPERESKIDRFKNWDVDVLANSMLLTRGVDIPAVDCIAPIRPTKSISLYMQMVGRGTRRAPGKSECLLLDFLYQASKKLICRPAHLIAKNEDEAELVTKLLADKTAGLPSEVLSQLDLMTVAVEASSQREEALRKKLEQQKGKQAKTISAEEFALQHHSMEAAEFEPTMKWHEKAVSEKQAKWLRKAGIELSTVRGMGHASQLLGLYFGDKSKTVQLASAGQRQRMRQMGHANWEHATEAEARQFFAALNKQKSEQKEMWA